MSTLDLRNDDNDDGCDFDYVDDDDDGGDSGG